MKMREDDEKTKRLNVEKDIFMLSMKISSITTSLILKCSKISLLDNLIIIYLCSLKKKFQNIKKSIKSSTEQKSPKKKHSLQELVSSLLWRQF